MDTIELMRTFAAVAQAGSFSGAARRRGISKALASKQVAVLERHLGICLLQRTTRAVTLTDAGRDALARCLAILTAVEELENEAASGRTALCGPLRIAGPPVLGEEVLAAAVASFVQRHPAIRVELMLEERAVDLVGEGFDLAVRVGTLADSSLVARRIGVQAFVFCATPAYLARRGTPSSVAELAAHDCVVDAALSPTGQWAAGRGSASKVAVQPRVRLNSGRAAATLVRAGVGVGLVARVLIEDDLRSGRLVQLFPECDAYDRPISVLYPHRAHLPARVAAFVEHLRDTLRTPPRGDENATAARRTTPAMRRRGALRSVEHARPRRG